MMQANKEIGKIADKTPLAIAKALELFIQDVINLSSTKARETTEKSANTNCYKITPSHIKEIIEENDKFEFLNETVKPIPSIEESKTKKKRVIKNIHKEEGKE
eukprot:CAMPEP_0205804676 /NCGR_PEP_ID=MMETSP0205-20121125/7668_1 /ASSEMBLY_ACC=CAM_ASM_000278 /TAXON_ID=36767 /ORGANISM="Euplotes focardii, Strain TN1" /LENGTH=102 /DNA_ID=CAMNT_0053074669 /DNA_START=61 /DNA_END=369 /DNA_ORIENTATION=-